MLKNSVVARWWTAVIRRFPRCNEAGSLWLAFVLLNAPYWALAQNIFISRALFNVDLLAPLMLWRYSRASSFGLLLLIWTADFVVNQSMTYRFSSPLEFLDASKYLPLIHISHFDFRYVSAWAFVFLVSASLAFRIVSKLRNSVSWGVVTLATLVALDVFNGSSMLSGRATRLFPVNLAGSPAGTFSFGGAWSRRGSTTMEHLAADQFATSRSIPQLGEESAAGGDVSPSVVLIVVESLGLYREPEMMQWIQDQIYAQTDSTRLVFQTGIVPARGTTTTAELRELCAISGAYQNLNAVVGLECLPNLYAKLGWKTFGVHGFSGNMFDRSTWWPLIGLKKFYFAEDLTSEYPLICGGAYAGICDRDVVSKAFQLAGPGRAFVYALTLNSHLPQKTVTLTAPLQGICRRSKVSDDVCMLTATLGTALRAVRLELAARPGRFEVTVVGDHPPPFSNIRDRAQFEKDVVPYFRLSTR